MWVSVEITFPDIIIARNKDNYGILYFLWPIKKKKVFDISTNFLYTYDGGSATWSGIPIEIAIEENIDDSLLDPCPKGIMEQLKKSYRR